MKRDNRNTGWDIPRTLWIRWNRIVSSPWTRNCLRQLSKQRAYISIYTTAVLDDFLFALFEAWRDFAAKEQVPFSSGSWRFSRTTRVCLPSPRRGGDCWLGRATSFLPRSVKSLYTFRGVEVTDRPVCFLPVQTRYAAWWWGRGSEILLLFLENHSWNLI